MARHKEEKKDPTGFKSEYADCAEDLVQMKDDAWRPQATRRKRLKDVRDFTNMLSTLTEDEAEELGRTEITNFGLTYREMTQTETMYTSMLTGTNAIAEVKVDTDNVEQDNHWSLRISAAINRHAFHFKGKLANFWKKCGGEMVIAGGGPAVQKPKYGWLPELCPDMIFPAETSLEAEQIPYAFEPKELTIDGLEKILKSVKDEDGKTVQKKNVEMLLCTLKEQIEQHTPPNSSQSSMERTRSVRGNNHEAPVASLSAWYFYEVKYDKSGNQHVSSTLFTDGTVSIGTDRLPWKGTKNWDGDARIIQYVEKAYVSPTDWLHYLCADSEIGGVKTIDTVRGIAELMFPAGVEIAELINLTLEGDKFRAKPFWALGDDANIDEVQKWETTLSMFLPRGVAPVDIPGSSQHLLTPFSILKGVASGLAGSGSAGVGRDQQLRVQALNQQTEDAALVTAKVADAYNQLDCLLETMVWRILAGPTRPGTEGYHDIMAVRAELDRYEIPYKELAKREHGRFQFISVKARRMAGAGSRDSQQAHAKFLMDNIANIPPGNRPLAMNMAFSLQTGDPDLADALSQVPQAVINSQKLTAENERDTIRFRAPLGQEIPVGVDDVHQDHIPIHLRDMQAFLARDEYVPWKKLDMLEFTGLAVHTMAHLQILLANPITNSEGRVFMRDFQKLVQASQAIAQRIEEEEGSEKTQLTAKEQADLEIKWAKIQLEGAKVGMSAENMKRLWESQQARAALSSRSQYAKEVNEDRRLKIDAERTAADIDARKKEGDNPQDK